MADIHFQDVYGELQDIEYKGIENKGNKKSAIVRSMAAQLHSTRLFNENYFAFLSALDDVVEKGIKYVILPGDFSDDGQPFNVRGLKQILDKYSEEKEINFFLTTGNHDPVGPFSQKAGKADFLGEGGMNQPIMSENNLYSSNSDFEHEPLISEDIRKMGYKGITTTLSAYGFSPKREYLYWETPFSEYSLNSYSYKKAKKAASLDERTYSMPSGSSLIPDVSYLVEPVEGVWLLAIDANVYLPKANRNRNNKTSENYSGSSIGYNNVLSHKKHLLLWVGRVTQRAKKENKTLIAFSHYPMVDFNNNASQKMESFFGEGKMQLHRVPNEEVAEAFANAGVRLHIGGHMHINNTGKRTTKKGNSIVNIQTPSLASYIPAYKILTIKENKAVEVETKILDSVPGFNEFFELYKQEHDFLKGIGTENVWDKEILLSDSYITFTKWHLKELTRLRFIPEDWPIKFQTFFPELSGKDLLVFALIKRNISLKEFVELKKFSQTSTELEKATKKAKEEINHIGLEFKDLNEWNGLDYIYDFYRLKNAGELAKQDIGRERIMQYKLIIEAFKQNKNKKSVDDFEALASIFEAFLEGLPSDHFEVNIETGSIKNFNSQN
ncbi:metallophosphoesterase [Salegentibacter sp. LM13S]|nr:metallophosphoesterase [Salegentibacter lacus]